MKNGRFASAHEQSELEYLFEYYWTLLTHDAPQYEREYKFHPARKFRFDFAFPASRVAIEVDGGVMLHRGGRHNTDLDRWKLNYAAALGWRVIRFSAKMIKDDPQSCIELVLEALTFGKDS